MSSLSIVIFSLSLSNQPKHFLVDLPNYTSVSCTHKNLLPLKSFSCPCTVRPRWHGGGVRETFSPGRSGRFIRGRITHVQHFFRHVRFKRILTHRTHQSAGHQAGGAPAASGRHRRGSHSHRFRHVDGPAGSHTDPRAVHCPRRINARGKYAKHGDRYGVRDLHPGIDRVRDLRGHRHRDPVDQEEEVIATGATPAYPG